MTQIRLRQVAKRYGGGSAPQTFSGLDLDIAGGEFTVLVGPSGCGKSTLLRMIAGLEPITEGELSFDGVRMNETPPVDRGVAMVFQNYALYAHMTVAQNIGFGLKIAGVPRAEREREVARVAEQLQLGALLQRKPAQLSGGQRQRVAIGRAIVRQPRVYLFDEPLSNLDASLRAQMRAEIAQLHRSQRATTVYVTHDQVEAMTLADRIVVLSPGKGLEQVGTPDELFDTPANVFVAGFIGSHRMNLLPVQAAHSRLLMSLTGRSVPTLRSKGIATVGVRPEHVQAIPCDTGSAAACGRVLLVERLGVDSLVHVQFDDGTPPITLLSNDRGLAAGQSLDVSAPQDRLQFFSADGQRVGA